MTCPSTATSPKVPPEILRGDGTCRLRRPPFHHFLQSTDDRVLPAETQVRLGAFADTAPAMDAAHRRYDDVEPRGLCGPHAPGPRNFAA